MTSKTSFEEQLAVVLVVLKSAHNITHKSFTCLQIVLTPLPPHYPSPSQPHNSPVCIIMHFFYTLNNISKSMNITGLAVVCETTGPLSPIVAYVSMFEKNIIYETKLLISF